MVSCAGLAVYSELLRSAAFCTTVEAISNVCGTLALGLVSTALFGMTAECSSVLIVTESVIASVAPAARA